MSDLEKIELLKDSLLEYKGLKDIPYALA